MTRLGHFCDRFLEGGWLMAVAITPMYFNIYSNRVFEPDKMIMMRSLVLVMALAQLVKWLEASPLGSRSASNNGEADSPRPGWWQRLRSGNPLALPTLLLVATYLMGTAVSVAPDSSLWGSYQRLQGTYGMLSFVALFFLIANNLRSRDQIERLFNVMLLVSVPISVYGIIQYQRLDPLPWGGDVTTRVTSTLGNAIFLAAYLIMVVPIALFRLVGVIARLRRFGPIKDDRLFVGLPRVLLLIALLLSEIAFLTYFTAQSAKVPNLWWAALPVIGTIVAFFTLFRVPRASYLSLHAEAVGYVLLLAVQFTAIVLTASRGPQIGLLAGLACFAILLSVRRRAWRLFAVVSALGAAALAFLIVFNLPNSPLASLRQAPYIGRLGSLLETEGGTGRVRILIWQGVLKLMATRPPIGLEAGDPLGLVRPLVGYGPESMYVAYNKVYPPDLAHYEARNASPDRSHNDTLDYLVNVGILGLAAYFFLLAAALYLIWRHLCKAKDLAAQLPLVAIVAALVSHFVESQTGIVIAATRTYFWVYLAIAVAAGLLYKRGEQEHSEAPAASSMPAPEASLVGAKAGVPAAAMDASARRRRNRRPGSADVVTPPRRPSPKGQNDDLGGRLVPLACLAFVVLLGLLVLGRTPPIQDLQLPMYVGFFGLLLAAGAIALSIGKRGFGRACQPGNLWLYGIATVVAGLAVIANLNVVAADVYFKGGFSADQARQFDNSILKYDEAIRLAGNQDYYHLFLGRAYLELAKMSQKPKVTPAFEPTMDKLRGIAPQQLGSLGREDLLNASKVVLEEARDLAPLNADHYANLARLHRVWGQMFGDRSKLDAADGYYSQALTLIPSSARLYDEWAEVLLDKGDLNGALSKVTTSAQVDPLYAITFVLQGDIYQQKGQPRDALAAHSKAIEIDPAALSDQRSDQRLQAYEKAGMLGDMEMLYAKAAKAAPNLAPARAAYGYILWRQSKGVEALAEFQAASRLAPNDWIAHRNLALIYQAFNRIDEAIASAQSASKYAPPDQTAGLQNLLNDLQNQKKPK